MTLDDFLNKDNVSVKHIRKNVKEVGNDTSYFYSVAIIVTIKQGFENKDLEIAFLQEKDESKTDLIIAPAVRLGDKDIGILSVFKIEPDIAKIVKNEIVSFLTAFEFNFLGYGEKLDDFKAKKHKNNQELFSISPLKDIGYNDSLEIEKNIFRNFLKSNKALNFENENDIDFIKDPKIFDILCHLKMKEIENLLSGHLSEDWADIILLNKII
jgi:hypothetical protein